MVYFFFVMFVRVCLNFDLAYFKIYSAIRLFSRKCLINSVFNINEDYFDEIMT